MWWVTSTWELFSPSQAGILRPSPGKAVNTSELFDCHASLKMLSWRVLRALTIFTRNQLNSTTSIILFAWVKQMIVKNCRCASLHCFVLLPLSGLIRFPANQQSLWYALESLSSNIEGKTEPTLWIDRFCMRFDKREEQLQFVI